MINSLQNKRVLVTRPWHQAKQWGEPLRAAGYEVGIFPLLTIHSLLTTKEMQKWVKEIQPEDAVIFVSANAVPSSLMLPAKPFVIAVGAGTAKALEARGISVGIVPELFSSEGILALSVWNTRSFRRVFIFCGRESKSQLSDELKARGQTVKVVECYERAYVTPTANEWAEVAALHWDAILFSSLAGLQSGYAVWSNFGKIVTLQKTPQLVVSQAMSDWAKAHGAETVLLAPGPMGMHVVEKLTDFWK